MKPVPARPSGTFWEELARARAALTSDSSPWPWIAVAVLAVATHLNSLLNPFFFDDWNNLTANPWMQHPHAIRKIFSASAVQYLGKVGVGNFYRPLVHLMNYAIYHLLGAQPGWFHLLSLALHAGVSLLVVSVVRRLSGRQAVGALAGLLFAVHPIHTEAIAWIAASLELTCAFFSLLTLWLYLRIAGADSGVRPSQDAQVSARPPGAAQVPRPGRRGGLLVALGASALLAQLSKETGMMAPVVIVAYELLVRRRGPLQQLRERWREYLALTIATALYLVARLFVLGGLIPVPQRTSVTWLQQLWTCLALFFRYLEAALGPIRYNFFGYYPVNRSPLEPAVLAGFLSLAAFLGFGVWLYRRRAPEVFALPLYLLPLLPVFQLPYIFVGVLMFDRAAYLPSVGYCWLVAAGLMKLKDKLGGRPAVVLAVILLAINTGRSAARMGDWRDEVEFFREGLARAPDFFHLHSFRAEALLRHNRPAEAVASLRESIRLRDDYADAHNLLGHAYWMLQQPEPALQAYRRAADLSMRDGRPDSAARAWNNIGIVYRSAGRNQQAIAAYRQALRLDPEFAATRNNLGYALLLEGQVEEAARELRTAIAHDPTLGLAYANLGLAYALSGQWSAARAALAEAERFIPNNPEVHARMGEIHLAQGEAEAARRRFLRALQLQPQNQRALAGMAALRDRQAQP